MKLTFAVDGTNVEFSRDWFSGRCTLVTDTGTTVLQSPWNLGTHYSLTTLKRWDCSVNGHEVVIEKQRPWLLAGLRPHTYRIFVDGKLVMERGGF